MRILLADDSVTAQNMGKKILSEAGHEVACVSNGAAALKKVAEQEPDLVILDIYMPGYSGLEVCQRLKEAPATANLPVVLTVGKLEPFRKEDAQRARAEALIIKPFEATELSAAVARFAEIVAANPPKPKNKSKLGPQAKPKPQWEEAPEDEFVTTTQKLQEEEEEKARSGAAGRFAAPTPAKAAAEPPAAAAEFEISSGPQAAEFPSEPESGTGSGEADSAAGEAGEQQTAWQPSAAAEFSVQAEELATAPPGVERNAVAKAAAAAAGADSIPGSDVPEFSPGGSPDFEVTAPPQGHMTEPAPFSPQVEARSSLPAVPEMSAAGAPEFSAAAAEPYAAPPVDPAFDPDRTQWATQFATHFGVAEETTEETAASAAPGVEAAESTPSDEIADILSNLPAGMNRPAEPSAAAEPFRERPWPTDVSSSGSEAWKAEELPVEDLDRSVSLAEEMEKASAAAALEQGSHSGLTEAEVPPPSQEPVNPVRIVESREEETPAGLPAPADSSQPGAGEQISEVPPAQPPTEESHAAESVPEAKPAQPEPDRVSGVMQSAAMAIATRATVSAVASQLHHPASESLATGPSAIEELVGQVLERLKPKLIAEIKRELKTPEDE